MMKLKLTILMFLLSFVFQLPWRVNAQERSTKQHLNTQTPSLTGFIYQGQLRDEGGPVTGLFDVRVALYATQADGEALQSIEHEGLSLANGLFRLSLDFGSAPLEAAEGWLEIAVRAQGNADSYTVLTPRQKLTSTPYAIFAQHEQWSLIGVPVGFVDRAIIQEGANAAIEADGATKLKDEELLKLRDQAAAVPQGSANVIAKFDSAGNPTVNSIIYDNGTNVGIGTTNPGTKLDIQGSVDQFNGVALKLFNSNAGNTNQWVLGTGGVVVAKDAFSIGDVSSYKMTILSNGNVGIGTIRPLAQLDVVTSTNNTVGVQVTITNGTGVFARSTSGDGVRGISTSGRGVLGQSTSAPAVQGVSDSGAGVMGVSDSGAGVMGHNNASGVGVRGSSNGGNHFEGGVVGAAIKFRVRNDGQVRSNVGFTTPAADFAEMTEVEEVSGPEANSYQPADVLIISPETGKLKKCSQPYCPLVAGIYSTHPGFLGGQGIEESSANKVPLALIGQVPCKVSTENGPIQIGDLLVTSSTPGYAMKGTDRTQMLGAIVGKALEPLPSGTGIIRVLVTLQ